MKRWTRRLLVGAVAVLVPALAGCEAGLNAPTQQYHPASNGARVTQRGITIDNLFVLGPGLHTAIPSGGRAGIFFSVTSKHEDRLLSISAPGTAASVTLIGGPVALSPGNLVLLAGPQPQVVFTDLRKPLTGGQTVPLVLTFANAGSIRVQAPVQPHAFEYATFSPPAAQPTATAKPGVSVSPSPGATGSQAGQPGASASASPSGTP